MANKTKRSKVYLTLLNKKPVYLSDDEYQKMLEKFSFRIKEIYELFEKCGFKVEKKSRIIGIKGFYIDLFRNGLRYPFYVSYLKNSGEEKNPDKRVQVYSSIPNFYHGSDYYGIAFYPTGDDELVSLIKFTKFAENKIAQKSSNYSSMWAEFDNLKKVYEKNQTVKQLKDEKLFYIFRKSNISQFSINLHSLLGLDQNANGNFEQFDSPPDPFTLSIEKLPRNQLLRIETIKNANFTCELCNKKYTFLTNENEFYFEAHHLIPFNISNQKMFNYSLDHLSNLVCLCPECHRKVHYSELKEQLESLTKLFQKRPNLVTTYNLKSAEELLHFYTTKESD